MLPDECCEAHWSVLEGCLYDLGRLSGGWVKAVLRVWVGCVMGVGRLYGECGKAV